MSRKHALVATLFFVLTSLLAWAQVRPEMLNGRPVAPGEVIVKFQHHTAEGIGSVQRLADADRMEVVGGTGAVLMHSRSKSTAKLLEALTSNPALAYAEPN